MVLLEKNHPHADKNIYNGSSEITASLSYSLKRVISLKITLKPQLKAEHRPSPVLNPKAIERLGFCSELP